MNKLARFQISEEAIAFQDGKLFAEIVKIFDKAGKEGYKNDPNQLSKLGLDDIVFKYTGLRIKTNIDDEKDFCIHPPYITKNNVLIPDHDKKLIKNNLGINHINQVRSNLLGWVDTKNCKVGGIFSKMLATVSIDPIYIFGFGVTGTTQTAVYTGQSTVIVENEYEITPRYKGGWSHTPEQNAAVFLHEIGHLFTMFEYLIESTTTNLLINNVCDELLETADYDNKMMILANAEKSLDLSIVDKEMLAKSESKTSVYTVLFSTMLSKNRSSTDTWVYDIKSWEFLADQFATRHGGGRHLAEALYSFDKEFGILRRTKFDVIASAVSTAILNVILIPFVGLGLITSLFSLFWDFSLDTSAHDQPIQRLNRIKADLTQKLKNPKLSKETKVLTIDDIERINFMLSTMEEHRSVMAVVWDFLRPARRDAKKQYDFQVKMEKLAGNSMFVHAAKLNTLS